MSSQFCAAAGPQSPTISATSFLLLPAITRLRTTLLRRAVRPTTLVSCSAVVWVTFRKLFSTTTFLCREPWSLASVLPPT